MCTLLSRAVCVTALLLAPVLALAADTEYTIVLESHRFSPSELLVPAGVKVRLVLENRDQTPEEFESYALNREKLITPSAKVVIYVGPLAPGRYEYFGDFNPSTARGWIVAKP
ncbi:MAG: cupredoxin domain-containing protein [Proteobacteria bacterium]|nr:cupredoxin domain-containing protein [Pseudomonadota bacterium]